MCASGMCLDDLKAQCVCLNDGQLEADVYPQEVNCFPGGDGESRFLDGQRIIQFALGNDAPSDSCEFARADCAPRSSLGDGIITVCDFVQALRYASGFDPLQFAGGPTNIINTPRLPGLGNRRVFISSTDFIRGRDNTITIYLDAAGDESAVGFSLVFDPAQLQYKTNNDSNYPYSNLTQGSNGCLSLIFLGVTQSGGSFLTLIPKGTNFLVKLTFTVLPGTNTSTQIAFGNAPTYCEIANTNADPLQTTFENASIAVMPPAPSFSNSYWSNLGFHALLNGDTGSVYNVESSTDLLSWTQFATLTNSTGATPLFDSSATGQMKQFYRAALVH